MLLIEVATEGFKASTTPQWVTRVIPHLVELTQLEVTVVTDGPLVVAYVIRQATTQVLSITTAQQLLNGPAVALKDFLASPFKGAPAVRGAIQGVTDWATEPNLDRGQRVGRVVVAAGLSTAIGVGVLVTLPEDAALGAVVLVTVGAGAVADGVVKPALFSTFGLNPAKNLSDEPEPAATVPE